MSDEPDAPKPDEEVQAQLPPKPAPVRKPVPAAAFSPEMTVAIVVAISAAVVNAAVYTFSGGSPAAYALSTFSADLVVITLIATEMPRIIGHLVPALAGVAALTASVFAFWYELPHVLGVTLAVYGLLLLVCVWQSWEKRRVAWAFLLALSAVLAVFLLFGAPKVRNLLHVQLWVAQIVPGLLAGATIALAMVRADYAERIES
jgi:hypothetical protein